MIARGQLLRERLDGEDLIFLPHLAGAEKVIAAGIGRLARAPANYPPIDIEKAIAWCHQRSDKTLAESQKEALTQALRHRVLVITGGPGVGKTTLVNSILMILRAKRVKCLLCAPHRPGSQAAFPGHRTGSQDHPPPAGGYSSHRSICPEPAQSPAMRPAGGRRVFHAGCSAHEPASGGPSRQQLADSGWRRGPASSVGPGMALHHVIASGVVPVVRLKEVFRQSRDSRIVTTAHEVIAARHRRRSRDPLPTRTFLFPGEGRSGADRRADVEAHSRADPRTDGCRRHPGHPGALSHASRVAGAREVNRRLQNPAQPLSAGTGRDREVRMEFPCRGQGHSDGEQL